MLNADTTAEQNKRLIHTIPSIAELGVTKYESKRKGKRKGGNEVPISLNEFIANARTNWFKYFDSKKFKKMKKKTNKCSG